MALRQMGLKVVTIITCSCSTVGKQQQTGTVVSRGRIITQWQDQIVVVIRQA